MIDVHYKEKVAPIEAVDLRSPSSSYAIRINRRGSDLVGINWTPRGNSWEDKTYCMFSANVSEIREFLTQALKMLAQMESSND